MKSEIENPFAIESDVFYGIPSTAKLIVPKGTKSKYQALSGWSSRFEEIVEETVDYTLSITSTGSGYAAYNGSQVRGNTASFTVSEGTATITFIPDTGYRIKSVKVNGTDVTPSVSNGKYTVSNISKNMNVEVEFEAITYTLTIKSTGSGIATYNSSTIRSKTSTFIVNEGSSATISFTPDTGYRIKSVKVNGTDVTSSLSSNK